MHIIVGDAKIILHRHMGLSRAWLGQRNLPNNADLSISRRADQSTYGHTYPWRGQYIDRPLMGCQVSLEFQIQFPNQVTGPILLGTAERHRYFGDNPLSPYFFKVIRRSLTDWLSSQSLHHALIQSSRMALCQTVPTCRSTLHISEGVQPG